MRRDRVLALAASVGVFFCLQRAWGFTGSVTASGTPIMWRGVGKLVLAGNPKNRDGLSAAVVERAAITGLQRWTAASQGSIGFEYWQGLMNDIYQPTSAYDGQSNLYFTSNSAEKLPSNVLGLTQVWFNPDNGNILETDIALNDDRFVFSNDPKDSSGYGVVPNPSGGARVYLQNVLTHELGHAFGLSHSGDQDSTMLFQEAFEQAHLSCDDQVAIRSLYSDTSSGVTGTVKAPGGAPIFGAEVSAINQARGEVVATAVTNPDGQYTFRALEPALYYFSVRPYAAANATLPSYYAGMNSNVCGGAKFVQTFSEQVVDVRAGQMVGGPTIDVDCSGDSRFAFFSKPTISPGGYGELVGQDRLDSSGKATFDLVGIAGNVEFHALSYGLGVARDLSIRLLDHLGNPVATGITQAQDVYIGDSGKHDFDAWLYATALPFGNYTLEITSAAISESWFALGNGGESDSLVMFVGQVGAAHATAIYPSKSRCRMDEAFPAVSANVGIPPRAPTGGGGSSQDQGGGCGSLEIQSDSKHGKNGSSGGNSPLYFGLPLLLALAASRLARLRLLVSGRMR